jgi:hypothetical protein
LQLLKTNKPIPALRLFSLPRISTKLDDQTQTQKKMVQITNYGKVVVIEKGNGGGKVGLN